MRERCKVRALFAEQDDEQIVDVVTMDDAVDIGWDGVAATLGEQHIEALRAGKVVTVSTSEGVVVLRLGAR